jgi:hypothetical protein
VASPTALHDEGPIALSDPPLVTDIEDGPAVEAEDLGAEMGDSATLAAQRGRTYFGPEVFAQEEIEALPEDREGGEASQSERRVVESPRPRTALRRSAVRQVPEPALAVPIGQRLRRHRNVLIFGAVGLMVVGTVAFRSWRAYRQELPRIAELGRVEGLAALDAGKFDRAHVLLSAAKRAVIALGDAYQGASAIRQGADEAAVIVQLCPETLEALLEMAGRDEAFPETFGKLYKGRTIIVDAHVTTIPDSQGNGRYELDYRIFREGEGGPPGSIGRVDASQLKLFQLIRPKPGDRVTFGARLASFALEGDEWRVGLEPDSGVIMTHLAALEALGWPSSAELGGEEDRP